MPAKKLGLKATSDKGKLSQMLAGLVDKFRQGGRATHVNWGFSPSLHAIFSSTHGYSDEKPPFDAVVQGVLQLNPVMLSEREVQIRLVYDFLVPQTMDFARATHLTGHGLLAEAEQILSELVGFQAWQDVDFPVSNLWLDGEPVELGYVTFMVLPKDELEKWMKDPVIWSPKAPDVRVVARVKAPGDQTKALSYARSRVDETLDLLRAFCFPFGRDSDTWRIGVLGDVISAASTPMRINNRGTVTRLGPGIAQIELRKDILSEQQEPFWGLVTKLILKTQHTNMENKLLSSIHWLAEATKPDTRKSKFAKVSFALETLIGGEPQDEELKVRGITAMLAERAAFLAGRDPNERLEIDKAVRGYYGVRSKIVHGGEEEVSYEDIDGFGQLVRRIAIALLPKLDELGDGLGTIEKLEDWVRRRRYGM